MVEQAKDYTGARFWAITGLGYGKGFTAEEAEENYWRIQRRNFPQVADEELREAWGRIWRAPEGTTEFVSDGNIFWEIGDQNVRAEPEQIVGSIGNVPDWAQK